MMAEKPTWWMKRAVEALKYLRARHDFGIEDYDENEARIAPISTHYNAIMLVSLLNSAMGVLVEIKWVLYLILMVLVVDLIARFI